MSNVTFYSFQILPFPIPPLPFRLIQLFIKKPPTAPPFLPVVLNIFLILSLYPILSIHLHLQLPF
ncbi:hypothetical protein [Bacillus altitudinis]|uniref:hypothetical protein n=1 Tax=Bacillus altitudinis TaxID=293387 RepID=UPI002355D763|nr:hypothetical protein [Bacillus altitudinis]